MRVTLIHNPGAGQQDGDEAKSLIALLRDAGHGVRYQSAGEEGWEAALEESADVVAVAGGDGTVSRVALRMAGRGVPVAPLPAGTANNISRTLGLVGRAWEELARSWHEARRVKLDVGVAAGPWGTRRFIEGVGAGLFACLLSSDDPERARVQNGAPDEQGKHLHIRWTGFELHLDDKLWRANGSRPDEHSGSIDVSLDGTATEFLAPSAKNGA